MKKLIMSRLSETLSTSLQKDMRVFAGYFLEIIAIVINISSEADPGIAEYLGIFLKRSWAERAEESRTELWQVQEISPRSTKLWVNLKK